MVKVLINQFGFILIGGLIMFNFSMAQTHINRFSRPGAPLNERWEWALREAGKDHPDSDFWLVFSIERTMEKQRYIWSNGDMFIHFAGYQDHDEPALQEVILNRPDPEKHLPESEQIRREAQRALGQAKGIEPKPEMVRKEIAILFHYPHGAAGAAEWVETGIASMELPFDLEKLPVYWIGPAAAQESLPFLQQLYHQVTSEKLKEELIPLAGLQEAADQVIPFLSEIISSAGADDLREEAAEWLGEQQDPRALEILRNTAKHDRSAEVREEAVEAIGQLNLPGAEQVLIDFAKNSPDAEMRETAIECLARVAADQAVQLLGQTIRSRDELEVKLRAVSILADLDNDAGLEELIRISRTHPDRRVRRRAILMLGESENPKALDALIDLVKVGAR
ncbi:MAG: HEAT repeat domain-containing protein [Calditrichae bacterium]|nr:HEAT repeat domain-containing protein [Calditrichia bacterium]